MPMLMPMLMPMPRFPNSQMIWSIITFVTLIFLFMNWDNIGIFNFYWNVDADVNANADADA